MKVRKSLIGLGIAGSLAFTAAAAFAQMPGGYPGMMGGGGGYPGMMGGGYPGAASASAQSGMGAQGATVSTDTTSTTTPGMPKTGGDPLTLSAAGSLLLSGGLALKRKFRGA